MIYRTLLVTALLATGCGTQENPSDIDGREAYQGEKPWGDKDAPTLLSNWMNFQVDELPLAGQPTEMPWAGYYWATYQDNINKKWGAGDPPSTKYAKAFDREGLEDRVSKEFGIDSRRAGGTVCENDDPCNKDLGEVCAKRDGADEGVCVPTWFGICHAWAPAAILESEPEQAVTYNDVEFKVQDIKALISLGYDDEVIVDFMSLRCNADLNEPEEMNNGVPVREECQDTNAGAFHVAIANLIGVEGKSIVEDRTIDLEVWNQPIAGYDVSLMKDVSEKEAQQLVDGEGDDYTLNSSAVKFRHVQMRLDYITESPASLDGNLDHRIDDFTNSDHYEYILELDAGGKIIGGEWVGDSRRHHPDFLWRPRFKIGTEQAKDAGKAGTGIKWDDIQMLQRLSKADAGPDEGGFDWGSACEDGNGDFTQEIGYRTAVEVGDIPVGKSSVIVELVSPKDVDIELMDVSDPSNPVKIVDWDEGLIRSAGEACATHDGVEYCYSGYNGVRGQLGREFIEIRGTTNNPLKMMAYGYQAGQALVEYRWKAPEDCVDSGEGTFNQDIIKDDVVEVGTIPAGKSNIRIELSSIKDVDVQLYAGTHAIVQWPDGALSGADAQTTTYNGMTIGWSGYNGDQTSGGAGNEYITVEGDVTSTLTMKAFGYEAGNAQIDYAWGVADVNSAL